MFGFEKKECISPELHYRKLSSFSSGFNRNYLSFPKLIARVPGHSLPFALHMSRQGFNN